MAFPICVACRRLDLYACAMQFRTLSVSDTGASENQVGHACILWHARRLAVDGDRVQRDLGRLPRRVDDLRGPPPHGLGRRALGRDVQVHAGGVRSLLIWSEAQYGISIRIHLSNLSTPSDCSPLLMSLL